MFTTMNTATIVEYKTTAANGGDDSYAESVTTQGGNRLLNRDGQVAPSAFQIFISAAY
ncbi:MAG: hypothetical protein QM813_23190 [Verrucomicrobiota bacterium]